MRDIFQRATLNSSDKAIIIALALIVIVLVLVIMYKIDNIPANFSKRKKAKSREEMYEDFEDEIEDEVAAEEKMEELFNSKEESDYTQDEINQSFLYDFNELNDMTSEREDINITYIDDVQDSINETKEIDENILDIETESEKSNEKKTEKDENEKKNKKDNKTTDVKKDNKKSEEAVSTQESKKETNDKKKTVKKENKKTKDK